NPALVRKVLAAYEEARAYALANPAELKKTLVAYTKLSDAEIERQLTRTELTHSTIGQAQAETIIAAGLALQEAGVVPAKTDVKAVVDDLLDRRFAVTN
ncbi:MAG: sulfonate ABC transporter substrate-binding protein, partial [Bosea sp. 32-68-6]